MLYFLVISIILNIDQCFQVPDVVKTKKSKPPTDEQANEIANQCIGGAKRKTKKKRNSENDESVSIQHVVEEAPISMPKKKRKFATSCEETNEIVSSPKKSKKKKSHEKEVVPAVASDFLKSPEKEVVLTEAQLAKQERKRQRQMKRLAKQMSEELQID